MLKMLSFLSVRAILTCKLRMKTHVGCLGVKWAARLMKRPWSALENIFSPEHKCYKNWGPEAIIAILPRKNRWFCEVGRLNGCTGAGRRFWRQFRNSEQFCCAALSDQVRSEGMQTMLN